MSKTLTERLNDAKQVLDSVDAALTRHPSALHPTVQSYVVRILDTRGDMEHAIQMIETRRTAFAFLDGLEFKVEDMDVVVLGGSRIPFRDARIIGTQAYVSISWALSDTIAKIGGLIWCAQLTGFNPNEPSQLVSDFVREKNGSKHTSALQFSTLKPAFGWPLSISYSIRNHFMHEGGNVGAIQFFEGPTAASAFNISEGGWDRIKQKVIDVNSTMHRSNLTGAWVDGIPGDLRIILRDCENELDEALGTMLISACKAFQASVACLLGED